VTVTIRRQALSARDVPAGAVGHVTLHPDLGPVMTTDRRGTFLQLSTGKLVRPHSPLFTPLSPDASVVLRPENRVQGLPATAEARG
jgi:hypothetical protein